MTPAAHHKLLTEIALQVEDNLRNEQFGVEELAESVGMSRSHLHRKLKEATGQSVSQFIREYRLQKARELLQNEDLTASEVAYQVGFGSATYFSKSFRDYYGYTPGEARQKSLEPAVQPASTVPSKGKVRKTNLLKGLGIVPFIALGVLLFILIRNANQAAEVGEADKSIAVLPFKNLSSDADNQYFADGMMEAVLNKLSGIEELKVTSRTSVERFRNDATQSIPEIADELNVTYILEGSAQKYGQEIRITAQLINGLTDQHIWSQDYTRTFEDVFQLQSEIAEEVATELQAVLSTDEQEGIRSLPTQSPEAYNYFLLADFQSNKWTEEGFKAAIPLFEKAIEIDSNYVDAYVGLANVWGTGGLVWGIYEEQEARTKSIALLEKALEINANHNGALDILGSIYFYYDWDFQKALTYYNRAKELQGYYGEFALDFFIKIGEFQTALSAANTLIELDPSYSGVYHFKVEGHYFMGNLAEALKTLEESVSLFDDLFFIREAAKLYYLFGELEKSKAALEKHKYLFPDHPPIINWLEAVHTFHAGDDPAPYIAQLQEQYEQRSSGSPAWFLAMTYAVLGDDQATFEWLEKSYERHEVEMTWLKMEPVLEPYQNDPRYRALLARMDFPK